MIVKETFYGVKCDRCGIQYEDGEASYWYDESDAVENAETDDWEEVDSKHYCPDCYEENEDTGEIKVYETL